VKSKWVIECFDKTHQQEMAIDSSAKDRRDTMTPTSFRITIALRTGMLTVLLALVVGCSSVQNEGREPAARTAPSAEGEIGSSPVTQPMPQLDEDATLHDYLTYALLNNPGLKSSFERWTSALERIPQARSLPDPVVNYGYFIRSIQTRVGPQRHRIELMQKIPFFGKLGLRENAALAEAKAAAAHFEQEKLNLLYRVKSVYAEYSYLGQAIRITEENVDLMSRLEEVASQRFRAGAAQQDVLKAQVELGKLTDRLASLQDMRHAVAAKLNAELNRPIASLVPWPDKLAEQTVALSQEQILQLARAENQELKALSFEVQKSEAMLALARKEYWPDFALGVGYIATGEAQAGPMAPADSGDDAIAAMVSVNLPIWGARLSAGVRGARAAMEATIYAKQQMENMLLSKVRFALYKYDDALRQLRLYEKTLIPKAEQAIAASEAGYRSGKVEFVNIIDGERNLLAFRLAYEGALMEQHQRLAELEMLVGRPLEATPAAETESPAPLHSDESNPPVDEEKNGPDA
jgi:cobalt-zinc-cadmium efflux system outer membrane protein